MKYESACETSIRCHTGQSGSWGAAIPGIGQIILFQHNHTWFSHDGVIPTIGNNAVLIKKISSFGYPSMYIVRGSTVTIMGLKYTS